MVGYAASEERIAKVEAELKRAADEEAETAQRLDSERQRRAALDQQLHEAREEATRLRLEEASQTRTALLAEAGELLQASRVEAAREADEVTKHASEKADEMIALARRKAMAIVDAGREEVKGLADHAARQNADLDIKHRELTHRLGVMETLYNELREALQLVAEIAIEELVTTQDSLKQRDPGEDEQPPTEPNSEPTTPGSAPHDELRESERVKANSQFQDTLVEVDQSVREARAEASREQQELRPAPEAVPEPDDDGKEELTVIIDNRDPANRRSRYQRWLSLNRKDRNSKVNRAHQDEAISERFSRVLSTGNAVESNDPEEVEARLRNMSHGTNSE